VAKIDQLRQWKNNETFNARDYVYERDTIVASVNSAYDEKVDKAGDTMTGDLNMGTNDIIQDAGGFVNHTSFQNGDEITDAVKIEYLKNIFGITGTVTRETGESWLDAYVRVINERLDGFVDPNVFQTLVNDLSTAQGNISTNTTNISTNASGISTNASAISSNTSAIAGKADSDHGHAIADITNLQDALDERVNIGALGTANGVAQLDAEKKVLLSQLPDSAKSQTFVQLSTDPRPTINILPGDKLYETDTGDSYIYKDETDGWVLLADADWQNVNLEWTNVTNTPTTLFGYGITDAYTQAQLFPVIEDPENPGEFIPDLDTLANLDGRYYTEKELDPSAANDANVLDVRYYREGEVDTLLSSKSDTGHDHTESDITDLDKYTQIQVDNLLANKVDVGVLSSNIIIYPTVTESDVTDYVRGVTSTTDPDYPTTAVDVTTEIVNGVKVPVGTVIADANLFVGNPGVISIPIVGNVRSSANNVEAEFYFEIYKRDVSGVETLIGQESTKTRTVTNLTYEEFNATALLDNGLFVETDRLVFKFFADKKGSVDGTFDFQYGGGSPVRILLNLPIDVTLQSERLSYDNTDSELSATNVQDALDEIDTNLDTHIGDTSNPHSVTTTQIGAAEAVHTHALTDITGLMSNGKIDSTLIPFQFDDVLQYADFASFPQLGDAVEPEQGKLYIDLSTNDLYRWDGSQYIVVKEALGALGEVPDVVLDNPQADEFLRYDGTNWVNDTVPIPDITTEFAAGVIETNDNSNLKFWRGTQAEYTALAPATLVDETIWNNEPPSQYSISPYTFQDVDGGAIRVTIQSSGGPSRVVYENGQYVNGFTSDPNAPAGSFSFIGNDTEYDQEFYIAEWDAGSTTVSFFNGANQTVDVLITTLGYDPNTEYIITDEATAPESISDLGDVNVGTITNNDGIANNTVLYYNETAQEWQNKEIAKSDVGLSAVQNYGIANSTEAVDDTNNSKYMTPYTTHLAIANETPDISSAYSAGVIETNNDNNLKFWQGSQAEYDALIPTEIFNGIVTYESFNLIQSFPEFNIDESIIQINWFNNGFVEVWNNGVTTPGYEPTITDTEYNFGNYFKFQRQSSGSNIINGIINNLGDTEIVVSQGAGIDPNTRYIENSTDLIIPDKVYNINLASGSWSGSSAPYTQTITTTGMTSNDYPFADIDLDGVSYGNTNIPVVIRR